MSSYFFLGIGNGSLIAFRLPGLDLGPYAEAVGGLHRLAISVTPERWRHLVDNLRAADVDHEVHSEV